MYDVMTYWIFIWMACWDVYFVFLLVPKVQKYLFILKYFYCTFGTSDNDNDICLWIIWMYHF